MNLLAILYFVQPDSEVNYNSIVKLLELVVFIRMIKLLTLLYEIKTMRIIIETMRNLSGPLLHLSGVLFTIFYVFTLTGMILFGGKVQKNLPALSNDTGVPDIYHLMNFNDMLSSFVTLFALMVVNNWMIQVQMFVNIMGGNRWYRLFFILFYYCAVITGINIVVAFAIDMYSSVERLDSER